MKTVTAFSSTTVHLIFSLNEINFRKKFTKIQKKTITVYQQVVDQSFLFLQHQTGEQQRKCRTLRELVLLTNAWKGDLNMA